MTITPLYAGILAIWFVILSYRVVQRRDIDSVNLGDGGKPLMLRRIRAHGNFAEYVPIILIMLGLLELSGARPWLLHALGMALLASRLLHGYALSFTENWKFGRYWGTVLVFLLLPVAGGLCIWQGFSGF